MHINHYQDTLSPLFTFHHHLLAIVLLSLFLSGFIIRSNLCALYVYFVM